MRNRRCQTAGILAAVGLLTLSSPLLAQDAQPPISAPATAQTNASPRPAPSDPAATLRAPTATPAERNEAARRLLADRSPTARDTIRATLTDSANRPGQVAVLRALAIDPEPDPLFLNDLLNLVTAEPPLNTASIHALANYRTPEIRDRFLELARDPERKQRDSTRLAAIECLGTFADKASAAGLMQILTSDNEGATIRNGAADGLIAMTGLRSNGHDASRWQTWWNDATQLDDATFELNLLRDRAGRFARFQRRYSRAFEEMQTILSEAYQAAPDKAKEGLLIRYLKAENPESRIAGVQIVHDEFTQNRPIPAGVRSQLRSMVGDSATDVRIEVVQALRELNDPAALDALLQQLAREPDAGVRTVLVETLVAEDPKVVPAILNALSDPSLDVAEAAAKGLAHLGTPVIKPDAQLSQQTAAAIQDTLQKTTGDPARTQLRAALLEALAPLKIPQTFFTFTRALAQGEPPAVRRAAARGLGELGAPGAADTLVGMLADKDESVRLAALDGLKLCAGFEHAEAIYAHLRPNDESSESVRQRAWDTLLVLFPMADPSQLSRWADRFMNQPERRLLILKTLADQLQKENRPADLAVVNQNIGEALLQMNSPEDAAKYFEMALEHHKKQPAEQTIADLSNQLMDALLASSQFERATTFASQSIAANQGNQLNMGTKLRNKVDNLRKGGDLDSARKLIEAIKRMNPPLAEVFRNQIDNIEDEIRRKSGQQPTTNPQKTVNAANGSK